MILSDAVAELISLLKLKIKLAVEIAFLIKTIEYKFRDI